MLRRLAVLPLLAALLLLPGCFWWTAPMVASGSGSSSSSYGPEETELAMANIRASIPAVEAYYADNGTYEGLTLELLQQRYDAGVQGITIVKANDPGVLHREQGRRLPLAQGGSRGRHPPGRL